MTSYPEIVAWSRPFLPANQKPATVCVFEQPGAMAIQQNIVVIHIADL